MRRPLAATASLNGIVLARTRRALLVEGTVYFPEEDVTGSLRPSALTTLCYWKGIARYRHLDSDGHTIRNAAWTYPLPSPLAWPIRTMVAFAPEAGIAVHQAPANNESTEETLP